jgi:hypothetical protein
MRNLGIHDIAADGKRSPLTPINSGEGRACRSSSQALYPNLKLLIAFLCIARAEAAQRQTQSDLTVTDIQ